MGYLVTIDPHLLSSPHVQPVLFFILSSLPLLWYFLAFYLFLRCLLMSTPLSLWIEGFSFCLFFHLHVLLFSFISSFFFSSWFSLNGVCLHFFTPFCLMSPSVFASSIPFSIPSIHSLHFTYTLGLLFIIKVFSHPHSFLFLSVPLALFSPVLLHTSFSTVLSFSCDSLGSHTQRLYLCLWERRQPSASN